MGIMSNTVSIYQYEVAGDVPKKDRTQWIGKCLEDNRFEPIDATPDPESVGWVRFDEHTNSDFSTPGAFSFEDYCIFTLRKDVRKVPAALLKNLVEKECGEWLKERPKLSKVPFQRKREIRENIQAALLAKSLPNPSVCDVLWNTRTNIVTIASISTKLLDFIEDEFCKTFEVLSLVPIHPIRRAERVLPEEHRQAIDRLNQASSRDVLLQIKKNRWIGWEFFLWLMYQSAEGNSEYTVNQEGPAEPGERFIAYLYDKFVLTEEHEDGKRKNAISGPQKDFSEARKSIQSGKNITEALLYFEKDMFKWKLSLKGDIFALGSFTCPPVKIEKDGMTDPQMERDAVFFERMHLMETGLQLFDSLFAAFLTERVLGPWPKILKTINEWLYKS
ncbi:MAG TPA: recombination-associated protein RdgC [Deltaproteobacteria bacterium]|nr:recombination-associated protein RdgC [Deltaproteobacteria bacterium]HQJ09570.1 recombination-associated protein RdgC [Deltaproteobacteria bacterium]